MIQTETRQIDGHEVTVSQFTAREGLAIITKIGKLIGPGLAQLSQIKDMNKLDEAELSANVLPAISATLGSLPESEFVPFVLRLLRSTFVDKKQVSEPIFDLEFAGNYSLLAKVLAFVLEINYKDFFGQNGIGSLLQYRKAQPTPQTE